LISNQNHYLSGKIKIKIKITINPLQLWLRKRNAT